MVKQAKRSRLKTVASYSGPFLELMTSCLLSLSYRLFSCKQALVFEFRLLALFSGHSRQLQDRKPPSEIVIETSALQLYILMSFFDINYNYKTVVKSTQVECLKRLAIC